MLALRYRTEHGERVIWPNQYQWLLNEHLIDWKDHQSWGLSRDNIRDKSSDNTLVKLIAFMQVSWFVAQSIVRAVHDLPLSQLEVMTLSYVPLYVVTYFFWWAKPKDVLTPSVIDLPDMPTAQKTTFEDMSVDSTFDDEHTEQQDSWWNIWKLTPRVFEKEARDKALEEMTQHMISVATDVEKAPNTPKPDEREDAPPPRNIFVKKAVTELPLLQRTLTEIKPYLRMAVTEQPHGLEVSSAQPTFIERVTRRSTVGFRKTRTAAIAESSAEKKDRIIPQLPTETVVAYWDPQVYHSKIWPIICLFGASFGALHLISWKSVFPTRVEVWLWRSAAITSIVSMLIFMQYKKVVLRWGGPLTLLSILSPAVYLISRIVMIAGVIASFRAMDPRIYNTYVVSTYWVHLL
jgi:hypothetical protein